MGIAVKYLEVAGGAPDQDGCNQEKMEETCE